MADFNGGPFADFIFGTNADDNMFGNGGDDFLNGQGENDLIDGGADSDTLVGDGFGFFFNKGADILTGGTGDDAYEFVVFDGDSTAIALDVVTDFEGAGVDGGDALQLRNSFFITGPRLTFGGLASAPTTGSALGAAGDGVATIFYAFNGGNTLVFGDTNDNGAYDDQDFTVRLTGTHALVAADFGDTDFVIAGTEGDDTITGTQGDDNIITGGGNDTVHALGGNDRVDGGSGDDIINGGDGDDQGDFSGDVALLGGDGNDQVNGGGGDDTASGGNGNDVVDGGDGVDNIGGGGDDDHVLGGLGNDFVRGDAGNDQVDGGDGDDAVSGNGGDDTLLGGLGDDFLSGDDTFSGVLGLDTLTGGAGADSFAWHVSSTNSTWTVQDLVTDFEGAGVVGGDTLVLRLPSFPILRLSFGGARAAPAFGSTIGTANDGLAALYHASVGGNTIIFADSDDDGIHEASDFSARLTGTHTLAASDFRLINDSGDTTFVIAGTDKSDTINGTAGADTIFGLGGNDTINGLAGNDNLNGGDGNDTVNGGLGNDIITGGDKNDTLNGDAGNDRINGDNGNDTIRGGDGRDRIDGGAGNDLIEGGAGDDDGSLFGGTGNDTVLGGAGDDTVEGGSGKDVVRGGADDDWVRGEEGDDQVFGEDGNDELEGNEGNDVMFGGDGDDQITGYQDADVNVGGAGGDEFQFFIASFNAHSTFAASDLVLDFEGAGELGGDTIGYRQGARMVWHGQQNISLTAGSALPGGGNGLHDLMYTFVDGNTWLIGDNNDDGLLDADDVAIEFVGIHNFTEDDFDLNFDDGFVTVGTEGDDSITGTEGDNVIFALGGNDQVFALGGSDEVHGGTGDDLIDAGVGDFDFDQLYGEEGNDTITLQNSGGSAFGGEGNDTLIGTDVFFGFDDLQGEAGDDVLQAGTDGSNMNGGTGSDQLISGAADDQMAGGFDFDTFELDGAQDLFVYTGTGRWSEEGSFFGDQVDQFEDGLDKFDMRGSGLQFSDLVIDNDGDFGPTITSDRGQITVGTFGVVIDETDFLFDSGLAAAAAVSVPVSDASGLVAIV